ncbi:hypothetical protein K440DRAFT_615217 [Wilcoxina mikolae CBS 423.85]|nr:hypothetical protein K440DRAFT_615217 [Wilcoxina mikolae CBS 423.85]
MAETNISALFASPPYTLLVGVTKKRYTVHSGLLSAKSDSLRALITGEWAENQSYEIDWSEWEEDTVKMFLEWLYTGTYTFPEPEPLEEKCATEESAAMEVAYETAEPEPKTEPGSPASVLSWSPNLAPLTSTGVLYAALPGPPSPLEELPAPATPTEISSDKRGLRRSHHDQHFNYSSLLMSHAKLYVLAQYTGVMPLKAIASRRLQQELSGFQAMSLLPTSPIIGNIIELVQYVYANTDRLVSTEEPLRKTVNTFCAHKFLEMQGGEFRALLEEGGDFAGDFWEKVSRKVKYDMFQADAKMKEKENAVLAKRSESPSGVYCAYVSTDVPRHAPRAYTDVPAIGTPRSHTLGFGRRRV